MTGTWNRPALPLVLLVLAGALSAQAGESGSDVIQTADEAIDRLPPIGKEGTWKELDHAVLWLKEHIATGGTLTDVQWARALHRSRAIRTRERWPVDEPFAVSVEVPLWLPNTEIRLYSGGNSRPIASAGNKVARCGNCAAGARQRSRYQEIDQLGLGTKILSVTVIAERGRKRGDPQSGPYAGVLWSGTLEITVEVVPSVEDVLRGAHDTVLDAAVRQSLAPFRYAEDEGDRLVINGSTERAPELATTALSLELELLEGMRVRETRELVFLDRPEPLVSQFVSWDLPSEVADLASWSIRVRGRGKGALRFWDATSYWDGELVIPLGEVPWR